MISTKCLFATSLTSTSAEPRDTTIGIGVLSTSKVAHIKKTKYFIMYEK